MLPLMPEGRKGESEESGMREGMGQSFNIVQEMCTTGRTAHELHFGFCPVPLKFGTPEGQTSRKSCYGYGWDTHVRLHRNTHSPSSELQDIPQSLPSLLSGIWIIFRYFELPPVLTSASSSFSQRVFIPQNHWLRE